MPSAYQGGVRQLPTENCDQYRAIVHGHRSRWQQYREPKYRQLNDFRQVRRASTPNVTPISELALSRTPRLLSIPRTFPMVAGRATRVLPAPAGENGPVSRECRPHGRLRLRRLPAASLSPGVRRVTDDMAAELRRPFHVRLGRSATRCARWPSPWISCRQAGPQPLSAACSCPEAPQSAFLYREELRPRGSQT